MPAPRDPRGARPQEIVSSPARLGVRPLTIRKKSPDDAPKATIPFDDSSVSPMSRRLDKKRGLKPQPHHCARFGPTSKGTDHLNPGLKRGRPRCSHKADRASTDTATGWESLSVTSGQSGSRNATSSSSRQSGEAETSMEDTGATSTSILSELSEQQVGPRAASYAREKSFILDVHVEAWIDPTVSGNPIPRTNLGIEQDFIRDHNREVPPQLPRMNKEPYHGAPSWVIEVRQDPDASPRSTLSMLTFHS